jgi:uncharacterized protein
MIVEIASIGKTPKTIAETFEAGDLDLGGENVALTSKAVFKGETLQVASRAHIRGRLVADVSFDCTRCLEPVSRRLDIDFDAIFVDAAEEADKTDVEVGSDALDESLVENGLIDIADVVREQILLAIPDQVFCRDDCKGLCPQCGTNLNLIDCKCSDDDIDPRWAALKDIKGSG